MKTIILLAVLITSMSFIGYAQPRPIERTTPTPAASNVQLPASVEAKYEGGMFGYSQKEKGQLKFDDLNERLVFYGEDGKEKFSVPFDSMLVVYPQSKSVTSTTGNVVSHIPLPGAGLAGFIKEKRRYLIMQIEDPEADVRAVVNFKLESKVILDSMLTAIGRKANLEQRGDAYYRPRSAKSGT